MIDGAERTFLETGEERLYAAFFRPAKPVTESRLLVICHPLFEEKKASHRPLVEIAHQAVAAGHAAVMLDYRGCGDSSGDLTTFIPADWTADALCGFRELTRRLPQGQGGPVFLGVRYGALVAVAAAAESGAAAELILVDPVVDGDAYLQELLRQKQVREMMTASESRSAPAELLADLATGGVLDLDGFALSHDFVEGLRQARLSDPTLPAGTRISVIQQGAAHELARPLAAVVAEWQKQGLVLETQCLRVLPFWKVVDLAETAPILAACRELLSP